MDKILEIIHKEIPDVEVLVFLRREIPEENLLQVQYAKDMRMPNAIQICWDFLGRAATNSIIEVPNSN